MNIAFFLTPKKDVVHLKDSYSIKRALSILSKNKYSSVPVIDNNGKYVRPLSEGDLLWFINERRHMSIDEIELLRVRNVPNHFQRKPVKINASMTSLVELVSMQSFVPVIDDDNVFIGIIKRSDVLRYAMKVLGVEEFIA